MEDNCILTGDVKGFCEFADKHGECPLEWRDSGWPRTETDAPCGRIHPELDERLYA